VHQLALSEDRGRLYALNTPEGRLEVFDVGEGGLVHAASVPVGLEPASLAVRRGSDEVWVVNQLSDAVSVVDQRREVVVATIPTADEPTDVVFASGTAFVSAGGRDDVVRVYDASSRAELASLDLFGDGPRALAASDDESEVYAVVLRSGNRTTIMSASGTGAPLEFPPHPPRGPDLPPEGPFVGLIVQFDPLTGEWQDELGIGRGFPGLPILLPDRDLFVIDALGPPSVVATVSGVGTALLDVAVQPGTGRIWIPNTDAHNVRRFLPRLRGRFLETRVSLVDRATGAVDTVDLNPHLDLTVPTGPPDERARSISQPGAGVFSSDGTRFYLTAFGSRKVAVLDGGAAVTSLIGVGGGPSGVALDEARGRLYVLNRFEQTISVVDLAAGRELARVPLAGRERFDPSPAAVTRGREVFYDAQAGSGHGDVACASCHPGGGADGLAWDLGDPEGEFLAYADAPWVRFFLIGPRTTGFDPMKGPMVTQTLRGVRGTAPFHWRGDRPDLLAFNRNFVELQGRPDELPEEDVQALADFLDTLRFPPNPFRLLDDSLPAALTVPTTSGAAAAGDPRRGETIFFTGRATAGAFNCDVCHVPPTGTSALVVNINSTQEINTPQLRNLHEKLDYELVYAEQKRGFGAVSDGSVSLARFLSSVLFHLTPQDERDLLAFLLAFPGDEAPAVGHQVTIDAGSADDVAALTRVTGLLEQARLGRCDVVLHGVLGGKRRGYVYDAAAGAFVPDDAATPMASLAELRAAIAPGDVLTFTGVPPGSGARIGIDRDRDGWHDGAEQALGFDAADPRSNPWRPGAPPGGCREPRLAFAKVELRLAALRAGLGRQRLRLRGSLVVGEGGDPAQDLAIDPLRDGIQLLVEDLGAGAARIFDLTGPRAVAPGGRGTGCDPRHDGWSSNRARTDFKYRNRSGRLAPACAAGALGLRFLRLTDRRPASPRIDVVAEARSAALEPPLGPLRVTLVPSDDPFALARGRCASATFAVERCVAGAFGGRFVCR
jgi:YVTN family beta-propeller protein